MSYCPIPLTPPQRKALLQFQAKCARRDPELDGETIVPLRRILISGYQHNSDPKEDRYDIDATYLSPSIVVHASIDCSGHGDWEHGTIEWLYSSADEEDGDE